ncbi:hypothetical protein EXIGLDRAFT_842792 [Exidia glandulosa HHB12029]|uniref:Ribonuclease H1 N-terminal domain-containing protein n=1 Tax=Exidia glandulosa HHB12029 TaxID=1314781 RepID=A0A165D2W8_EXIGL|nr:hypothetical protein EXIGLDRAFT_842792 [Exidia glandulosa HHB12029]
MARPKFYAVWRGRHVGVFQEWEKVKMWTDGVPNAGFRGFKTRADAEDYMRVMNATQDSLGRWLAPPSPPPRQAFASIQAPAVPTELDDSEYMPKKRFYAISKGRNPEILHTTWDDARKFTEGVKDIQFKGFGTLARAEAYMTAKGLRKDENNAWVPQVVGSRAGPAAESQDQLVAIANPVPVHSGVVLDQPTLHAGEPLVIFVAATSEGGIGVYFADNNPLNISARYPEALRAEAAALICALESAPPTQHLVIYTSFSLNAARKGHGDKLGEYIEALVAARPDVRIHYAEAAQGEPLDGVDRAHRLARDVKRSGQWNWDRLCAICE